MIRDIGFCKNTGQVQCGRSLLKVDFFNVWKWTRDSSLESKMLQLAQRERSWNSKIDGLKLRNLDDLLKINLAIKEVDFGSNRPFGITSNLVVWPSLLPMSGHLSWIDRQIGCLRTLRCIFCPDSARRLVFLGQFYMVIIDHIYKNQLHASTCRLEKFYMVEYWKICFYFPFLSFPILYHVKFGICFPRLLPF